MKDKGSHIDQLFQNELSSAEFAVNDSDWSAIQGKMKTQRKRRLIWWLPVVLLVSAIATWAFWPENMESKIVQKTVLNTAYNNAESIGDQNPADPSTLPTNPTPNINQSITSSSAKHSVVAGNDNTTTDIKGKAQDEKLLQEPSAINTTTKVPSKVRQNEIVSPKNINEVLLDLIALNSVQSIQFPMDEIGNSVNSTSAELLNVKTAVTSNIKPANLIRWSLGAQFGLQSSQLLNPIQLDEYKVNPKAIYTPRLGLNANMHWSNWSLSSGLGYQASGQSGGQYKRELYDSIPVRNPQGDTIGFFRRNYRDSIVQDDQVQIKAQYLSIPLQLGYRFNLNNSLTLGVQVGIAYNRLLGVEGQLTDVNGYLLSEAATASAFGKQYFDWNTQLSVAYKLKNIQLGVNGGIGQSITDPGGSLPNNYQWKQWNTGVFIKYSLPKKRTGL